MYPLTPQQVLELSKRAKIVDKSLDLACPDCQGKVFILAGKFGLFYRCRNRNRQCDGVFSANDDGSPKGIPANKETRAARSKIHRLMESRPELNWGTFRKILDPELPLGINNLSLESCEILLRHFDPRPTFWQRLLGPPLV